MDQGSAGQCQQCLEVPLLRYGCLFCLPQGSHLMGGSHHAFDLSVLVADGRGPSHQDTILSIRMSF